MLTRFTESHLRVMELLARYKFLTVPQMVRLGLAKHRSSIYSILRTLPRTSRTAYIDRIRFGVDPRRGQLPAIYHLLPKGVEFLVQHLDFAEERIRCPKNKHPFFARDYDHRVGTVDAHIAMELSVGRCGGHVEFVETYFDYEGGNRGGSKPLEQLTRIDLGGGVHIVPDAAFLFEVGGERKFFLFEFERGHDTKDALAQVRGLARALELGLPSQKYGLGLPCRVLFAFERQGALDAILKRVAATPSLTNFAEYFLFAPFDTVRDDFGRGWVNCQMQPRQI